MQINLYAYIQYILTVHILYSTKKTHIQTQFFLLQQIYLEGLDGEFSAKWSLPTKLQEEKCLC